MKKKGSSKFVAGIQKVGRAFFLPISVLPIAGLLLGIGGSFTNPTVVATYGLEAAMGPGSVLHGLLTIMSQVGGVIFGNLPLIFALAVALGIAKNEKAVAVLAAGISFLVMNTTMNAMLKLSGKILPDGSLADSVVNGTITTNLGMETLQMGVFGGIIVGLGVGWLHNKYYKQQLPTVLSFFSGLRFVPIISVVVFMFVGIGLYFVWPVIQTGIYYLGDLVIAAGWAGTFVYGFLERILIPFGLHHIFYMPFWQTGVGGTAMIDGTLVEGAQNIFFAELASPNTVVFGDTARFLSGKYAFMMAGLPAAALAMYHTAKPENRKIVGGLLFSAALTSFITGITEPIEFTFLFVAPWLFVIHAVLAGISFLLVDIFNIAIGTTFSCGLIDFTLYGILQGEAKTGWMRLLPIFLGYAVVYYFLFKTLILKFNLPTPGRGEGEADEIKLYTKDDYKNMGNKDYTKEDFMSAAIVQGLGGIDNIVSTDCCATRLRMAVKDGSKIDKAVLMATGASGVMPSDDTVQVIYGPKVSIIKSELSEFIAKVKSGAYDMADFERGDKAETEVEKPLKEEKKVSSGGDDAQEIFAVVDGEVIAMEEAADPTFSEKMLGDGVAIRPTNGTVVAPADATVTVVMQKSLHAVGLSLANGAEMLIHIGLDTVKMEGEGFEAFVKDGDKVKKGDKLIQFDPELVKERGYSPDVIMIMLTGDKTEGFDYVSGINAKAGKTLVGRK